MTEKTVNIEKVESTLLEVARAYTSSPSISVVLGSYVLYIARNTPELTELEDIFIITDFEGQGVNDIPESAE
jgi:hypothetical protein